MNETKQKGLVTEIECELAFAKLGILLSKPIVEDSRYDYLADIGNTFLRIQCKTSSVSEDNSYIEFATRTARSNTKETYARKYTKKEIDYFYTYYNNKSYLVPVEECSTTKKLRFVPTKSGQIDGISFAKDFELEKILKEKEFFNDFQKHEVNIISSSKKNDIKNNQCIKCGKPVCDNATMCVQCYNLSQRKVKRPSREQLKILIRTQPFTKIAEKYKVTDNAIRKWCDSFTLPRRKKDIELYTDQEWKEI